MEVFSSCLASMAGLGSGSCGRGTVRLLPLVGFCGEANSWSSPKMSLIFSCSLVFRRFRSLRDSVLSFLPFSDILVLVVALFETATVAALLVPATAAILATAAVLATGAVLATSAVLATGASRQ